MGWGPGLLKLPEEFLLLSTVYASWVRDTFEKDSLATSTGCLHPLS